MDPTPAAAGPSGSGDAPTDKKSALPPAKARSRGKRKDIGGDDGAKRRCVSTACIACRKRKSKCDGNLPACAACSSVYYTECLYDPGSDHRRKGVYKKDDNLKTRNTTLEVLVQALLNVPEDEVSGLVQQIRTCESLDAVAEEILAKEAGEEGDDDLLPDADDSAADAPTFEKHLSTKMGQLRMEEGSARYIGGTSNLLFLAEDISVTDTEPSTDLYSYGDEDPITSWTTVTQDPVLIEHLITMYFTWHYPYFTTLSKSLFMKDFRKGYQAVSNRRIEYCTPLLVNAMLALGCHFTAWPQAREIKEDSATAGDQFFKEAKRLIMADDEYEKPKLATVQALALMSVREAGCGRESKGWVYSGMSFRMACDLGINLDSGNIYRSREAGLDEEEIDARRITLWGCFLFDKCWSNYMGRLPQLPLSIITQPKFEVFPTEDAETWVAYTDSGQNQAHAQPGRIRAIALQISELCEISGDLMTNFYNPIDMDKSKGKQSELKKLSDIHQRLESWRRNLPVEMEPKEGGLPSMLVMHMFFQLLYIHLFRPFLKYNQATSPLPPSVSPRRLCTQAAAAISKLLRLYKRSHGLRQICNIAVYIAHSACTIHLLNLPDKNAKRDITHGVKHLEEIAESWLCARRTLAILSILSKQWKVDLPEEAATVLSRTDVKFSAWGTDISRRIPRPSGSPAAASPQHVNSTSPNFFIPGSAGSGPSFDVRLAPSPQALPPQNAADLIQRSVRGSMASTSSPGTRTSLDASGSPSAIFGTEQLPRNDGGDWWITDQRELAWGFGQWPQQTSPLSSTAHTVVSAPTWPDAVRSPPRSLASPVGNRFPADDQALKHLFSGLSNGVNGASGTNSGNGASGQVWPGMAMQYPNESEWYQ